MAGGRDRDRDTARVSLALALTLAPRVGSFWTEPGAISLINLPYISPISPAWAAFGPNQELTL